MSRSLKKGPYIEVSLEKKIVAMNESGKKNVVKTWSRASMISPDFVGHTVAVHNGNKFIPVYVTENMVLGANPVVVAVPIGAEENFKGIVDLLRMKAILWHDETMGAEYDVEDIPADMKDECDEWRAKLVEAAAESSVRGSSRLQQTRM